MLYYNKSKNTPTNIDIMFQPSLQCHNYELHDFSTLYSYMVILKTLRSNNISGTTALHENVIKLFLNKKETNGI